MADYLDLAFGNLAYDPFSTAAPQIEFPAEPEAPEAEPRYIPRPERQPEAAPRRRVRTEAEERALAQARVENGILAALIAPMVVICLGLMVLLLVKFSQLTALSNESAGLEKQIADMKKEHSRLEIACEQAFNMEEVEQTAQTVIGMVKADSDQVIYLRSTADDMAMILNPDRVQQPLLERIAASIRKLLSYIGQGYA